MQKEEIITSDKYDAQKKHLSQKKQLRVWIDAEKFDRFKLTVTAKKESIYGLVNKFVDDYLAENENKNK